MKVIINPKEGVAIPNYSYDGDAVFETEVFSPGETITVSDSVATDLLFRYGFLEKQDIAEEVKEEVEIKPKAKKKQKGAKKK